MAETGKILIVCAKEAAAAMIAAGLDRQGLETVLAVNPDDALAKMEKSPCDLVLCEADLEGASGLTLLERMRKEFPLALRVIIENAPLQMDTRQIVNEIAPCAIFRDSPNPAEIRRLVAMEGPVSHVSDVASVDLMIENEKWKKACRRLSAEKDALEKQIEKLGESREKKQEEDREPQDGQTSVSEAGVAQRAVQLSEEFEKLMQSEEIVLPVVPQVGLEVQRLLADERCTFEMLAEKVGMEQGMSARILQVANSPLYAGLKRIRNLREAVGRLGFRRTRILLQAVLAENLFTTSSRSLSRLMSQLWLHSLCTAHCNEQIAQTLEIPESDDYFMMGLLHDIGKLLVVHLVDCLLKQDRWQKENLTEEIIKGLMNAHHHEFGRQLMIKWQYSKIFQEVVFCHNDDEHIVKRPEPVIVTYFSNLLARKLGYSLVPYESDLLSSKALAEALNMSTGTRFLLEEQLGKLIADIRETYQIPSS